jgi:hypothetical protein
LLVYECSIRENLEGRVGVSQCEDVIGDGRAGSQRLKQDEE